MTDGPPDADAADEVDAAFGVLSNAHRRYALYYLRDRDSTTLEELATVLAGWLGTREDRGEVVTPEGRDRFRTVLHHVHLPELEAAGLVRYDRETYDVLVEPLPDFVERTLDTSLRREREASEPSGERNFDFNDD